MLAAPLLLAAIAAGPDADLLRGTSVRAADAELLPAGGFAASLADEWLLEAVNLRHQGGALGLFEPLALSAYGWSALSTRFLLNGIEVTDPARPGEPLLEVPQALWSETRLVSLWAASPEYEWTVEAGSAEPKVRGRGALGAPLGGGTWIPRGLIDREPALASGATPVRRALRRSADMIADARLPYGRAAVEHIDHALSFPTLSGSDGELLFDRATRTSALAALDYDGLGVPLHALALWQRTRREHAGAEFRHPAALTLGQKADAFAAQLSTTLARGASLRLEAGAGMALRQESLTPSSTAPVRDLEDEWLWTHRLQHGEDLSRQRYDMRLAAYFGEGDKLIVRARAGAALLRARARLADGLAAVTFARATRPADRALWLDLVTAERAARERLDYGRLELEARPSLGVVALRALAALDYGAATARAGARLRYLSPAVGVAASVPLGGSRLVALVRHEPLALDAEVSTFLDQARPSARRYAWSDDGDFVPEPGEEGPLLARFGGEANAFANGLARPTSSLLALGWQSAPVGPLRFSAGGVAHVLAGGYTVVLAGPAAESYAPVAVGEVEGEAAGLRADDRALTVYARAPGSEGSEIYELQNVGRPAYYLGAEIRLDADAGTWWFASLGATGYYSLAQTPFGLFADRNDPGVIDARCADPNCRVNAFGSADAGRAYHIKLQAGARPFENWHAAAALRYRDGEPMARLLAVEGLPQGPALVMAQSRGNPVPRFTFHMTLDVRVRYARVLAGTTTAVSCDVFNLLGSGTEILEDVRTGESHRRALEMMPGRAVLLTAEAVF